MTPSGYMDAEKIWEIVDQLRKTQTPLTRAQRCQTADVLEMVAMNGYPTVFRSSSEDR